MRPSCFCHDCRSLWDKDGKIDLALIKMGHELARHTYASILPSKKDILRDLRSNTDSALEDFVKAQMELFAKMNDMKQAQADYDKQSAVLSDMNSRDYTYLKSHEAEMDEIERDLFIRYNYIKSLEREETRLEEICHKAEAALKAARKAEHDFIEETL
jgi:septal ring factor EnvC (AmiA/AmiB activator)